jgi:hypothetical protein
MKKWGWIFCLAPLAAFSSVENAIEDGVVQSATDVKVENIQGVDEVKASIVDSQLVESQASSNGSEVTWNFEAITKDSPKFVGEISAASPQDLSSAPVALAEPVTYDFDEENDGFSFEEMDDYTVKTSSRPKIVERNVTESNQKNAASAQKGRAVQQSSKAADNKPSVKSKQNVNNSSAARSSAKDRGADRSQGKKSSSRVATKEKRQNMKTRRYALSDDQGDSDDGSDYEDSNPAPKNNGSQKPKSQPQPQPQQGNDGQGQRYNNRNNASSNNKARKGTKQSVRSSKDEGRSSFRAPKQMVRESARSERASRSHSEDEYYDDKYEQDEVRPAYKNSKRLSSRDKDLSNKRRPTAQRQNRVKEQRKSASASKERRAPKARISKRDRYDEDDYQDSRSRNRARAHSGKRPSTR